MPRVDYSRAEIWSDGVVHVAGLVVVAAAVPVLVAMAAVSDGGLAPLVGATVYGTTLILMLLCSALYNMVPSPRWSWLLRRLDHSAIYLKIAGTFTPFALVAGAGAPFLAAMWGAALTGVSLKLISPSRFRMIGLALYLGMGWVGVGLGWHAFSALPMVVIGLMVAGGLLYTAGVIFYLWDDLPFHNTIWHGFVLTATLLYYAAVFTALKTGVAVAGTAGIFPDAGAPGMLGAGPF